MTFRDLESKYNVKIFYKIQDIPKFRIKGIKHKQISTKDFKKVTYCIDKSLSKYNTNILSKYLKKIYIVKQALYYDDGIYEYYLDGVMIGNSILVALRGGSCRDNSNTSIIKTIHHELNHIVVEKERYSFWNWKNTNYRNMEYDIHNKSMYLSDKNYSKSRGFVRHYGKISPDEDMATVAEEYFVNKTHGILNTDKVLSKKTELFKKFYDKLNLIKSDQ